MSVAAGITTTTSSDPAGNIASTDHPTGIGRSAAYTYDADSDPPRRGC